MTEMHYVHVNTISKLLSLFINNCKFLNKVNIVTMLLYKLISMLNATVITYKLIFPGVKKIVAT